MFTRIALLLIALVALPFYWLLMDPGPTSAPVLSIDIARLRTEAARQTGPRPVAIEYAAVATVFGPGALHVAGGGLKYVETAVIAWRLATPGGDTIINAGLTPDQALTTGFSTYRPEMQARVETWLRSAKRILLTSEEIDHIGGLVGLVNQPETVLQKVTGNAVQVETIRQLDPASAAALKPPIAALSGPPGYAAIAPGVAALRTPGHLAGSQMVYVQLQDGREFLFTGDTAPLRRNVTLQRPRSRYLAEWRGSEDRAATTGWLKGLAQLKDHEPRLTLVYAHDLAWLEDSINGPRFAAAPGAMITKAAR